MALLKLNKAPNVLPKSSKGIAIDLREFGLTKRPVFLSFTNPCFSLIFFSSSFDFLSVFRGLASTSSLFWAAKTVTSWGLFFFFLSESKPEINRPAQIENPEPNRPIKKYGDWAKITTFPKPLTVL